MSPKTELQKPDKFGVLYRMLHLEFHGLTAGSTFQCYHTLFPSINSFFIETVWVPFRDVLIEQFLELQI